MRRKLAIIGLGMIGGSIARALRKSDMDLEILAYDSSETLALAQKEKIIDFPISRDFRELSDCNVVFLCAPVTANQDMLGKLDSIVSSNCLVTDVSSIKSEIMNKMNDSNYHFHFIGGHPMAGSERTGYLNSYDCLLENAYYILIPGKNSTIDDMNYLQQIVQALGAIPINLTVKTHDYSTAAISHIPHIIASALVRMVKDSDDKEQTMKLLAAGGFKDITRIASSSSNLWEQICIGNKDSIVPLLEHFIEIVENMRDSIVSSDHETLLNYLNTSREYREQFISNPNTTNRNTDLLHVTIIDKPGAIAKIATLLADEGISIKNIGISHNREIAEGALYIEFMNSFDASAAKTHLQSNGYLVFEQI